MSDLRQRMYSGISTSGAVNFGFFLTKGFDRLFQKLLYTRPVQLFLPAEQIGAVIFYGDFVALCHYLFF